MLAPLRSKRAIPRITKKESIMRSIKYALIGTLLLAAAPAFAQRCSSQFPPSFNNRMGPFQSCNSLPAGGATAEIPTFGGQLGVTRTGPAAAAAATPAFGGPQLITPRQEPVLRGSE
jgi:hypothetical protein